MAQSIQPEFYRHRTVKFFQRCLDILPSRYGSLDSNRVTVAFFAISGLDMLNSLSVIENKKQSIIDWVYSLQVLPGPSGSFNRKAGFQGSTSAGLKFHSSKNSIADEEIPKYVTGHLAMTYTALAILLILGDDLKRVNRSAIIQSLAKIQLPDGSFQPTVHGGESDARFLYCACCISYMLKDWSGINIQKSIEYIRKSQAYDGGLGQGPGLEAHGGSSFCAIASLHLMGKLNTALSPVQLDKVIRWCMMRQQSGFQGRPNKPADSCYSFWVGATLKILQAYDLINEKNIKEFTLSTQDPIVGGFSKWPDNSPDALHSYFSIAGLSLMNYGNLSAVHPALNISQRAVAHLHQLHTLWTNQT